MANVVRRDVVQIGFDINDSPIRELLDMMERVQREAREVGNPQPFNDLTQEIRDVANASDLTTESLRDFRRRAEELGNVDGADELRAEIDRVSQQSEITEEDLRALQRAADRLGRTGIEDMQRDLQNAQAEIQELRNRMRELERVARGVGDSGRGAGEDTAKGAKEADGKMGGLIGTAGKLAGALVAVGAAAVGAFSAFGGANEAQQNMNRFQAQTGVSTREMKKYTKSINSLYADGMGESIGDVSDSMALVKQTTGMVGKELKNTTNSALLLRDTFDFDVQESIRSVDMMMKKFGVSADEAYSMIAQGAQNGLNKNGDLLDTVNEYSVHFQQLGFNAEEMFNMLVNGAKSGTFSVDKLGDAVKEFGVRVVDGSESTAEGFSAIGLNADTMARKFKEGGDVGKAAFAETVEALKAMKDPIAQEAAGVALFGTMWEDLGKEGVFALSTVTGEVENTTDALKKIGEVRYNDVGSALEAIKRKGIVAMNTYLTPVLNKMLKLINRTQEWAEKVKLVDKFKAGINRVKTALKPVTDGIKSVVDRVKEFATAKDTVAAVQGELGKLRTVFDWVASKFTQVKDWIVENAWMFKDLFMSVFGLLKDMFSDVQPILGEIIKGIKKAADAALNRLLKTLEFLIPLLKVAFDFVKKIWNILSENGVFDSLKGILSGLFDIIAGIFNLDFGQVWEGMKKAFSSTIDFWIGYIKSEAQVIIAFIAGIFQLDDSVIYDGLKKAWNKAKEVFSDLGVFFSEIGAKIKAKFDETAAKLNATWTLVKTVFAAVVSWFSGKIEEIKTFFSALWGAITVIFSAVSSYFTEKFTAAYLAVKAVFAPIVSFFSDIWERIKGMFTTIGTTIGNAIGNAFATVVNSIIGFAEKTINGFIRNINNAISLINEIPGVDIPTVPELSIPRLAKGGIVDKPTIAQIGENGKEAIVPLEKNLGWIKNIASNITAAMTSASGSPASVGNVFNKRNTSQTVNNNYNPTFVLNMNGASATEDNKRKFKQWFKESMKEMFDDLDSDNQPLVEV